MLNIFIQVLELLSDANITKRSILWAGDQIAILFKRFLYPLSIVRNTGKNYFGVKKVFEKFSTSYKNDDSLLMVSECLIHIDHNCRFRVIGTYHLTHNRYRTTDRKVVRQNRPKMKFSCEPPLRAYRARCLIFATSTHHAGSDTT